MQLDLNSGILLIGIVQGLFLSFSIALHKQGPRKANLFLIILLLSFVLALTVHFLNITELWKSYLSFFVVSSSVVFLFGPSLYLYVALLTQTEKQLSWWHLAHLIPIAVNLIMFLPLFSLSDAELINGIERGRSTGNASMLLPMLKAGLVTCYTIAAYILLVKHFKRMKANFSDLDKISLHWLRNLILGFITFEVLLGSALVFKLDFSQIPGQLDTILSLILIGLIFMTGFKGLQQPEIFSGRRQLLSGQSNLETTQNKKYQVSNINRADYQRIEQALKVLFDQESVYLDRFLDLRMLSEKANITTHQLSQFLNEHLGTSFYDYINRHRIEAAKRHLIASNSAILDIALEVGFNNKATFNKAFKKYTQITPTQFRKQNQ